AFAVAAAVDVGGIEEGDAELERPLERPERLGVVGGPVAHPAAAVPERPANAPATHADVADDEVGSPEPACGHHDERLLRPPGQGDHPAARRAMRVPLPGVPSPRTWRGVEREAARKSRSHDQERPGGRNVRGFYRGSSACVKRQPMAPPSSMPASERTKNAP